MRRAAGLAVFYAVPVVVPDGGYALSGLRKAAEPELSNSCSTPQARASAAPPGWLYPARSRPCAGWWLRLIRPTEGC